MWRHLFTAACALSLVLLAATVALWVRSFGHAQTLRLTTAWGPRGSEWVARDLTLSLRPGSMMIVRRTRTWSPPPIGVPEPSRVTWSDSPVPHWHTTIWSVLGRFGVSSRSGSRPLSIWSNRRIAFYSLTLEFPVWLATGAFAVMPAWWGARFTRRGRLWLRERSEEQGGSARAERPWRWGPRAAIIALVTLLVGLAVGASGMSSLTMAIWIPGAAVALVLLSDPPRPWRRRNAGPALDPKPIKPHVR